MSKKTLRMEKLLSILNETGSMSIKKMAHLLEVSEMTIRRDLRILEAEEKVKNINGILVSHLDSSFHLLAKTYDLSEEARIQNEAKRAIGQFAAAMVQDGDRFLLDIGTTIEQIAKHLSHDISFTAFCVSLNTLLQLVSHPGARTVVSGGYYLPNIQAFVGEESVKSIQNLRSGKLFLSAAGIHEDLGITCVNNEEVRVKKAMLQSSARHILVIDSSKFGVIRSGHVCGLSDIDEIITDDRLPDKWVSLLERRGIVLHRVPIIKKEA